MITLNKRLSVLGRRTPWPDGSSLSSIGERSMVMGRYAADFWPPPPSGIPFTSFSLIADSLVTALSITAGTLNGSLSLTSDTINGSITVEVDG